MGRLWGVPDKDHTRVAVRRLRISAGVGDQGLEPEVRGLGFSIQVSGLRLFGLLEKGLGSLMFRFRVQGLSRADPSFDSPLPLQACLGLDCLLGYSTSRVGRTW